MSETSTFSIFVFGPFLCSGAILDIFHCSGIFLCLYILFISSYTGFPSIVYPSLSIRRGILSHPWQFFCFRFFMMSWVFCNVMKLTSVALIIFTSSPWTKDTVMSYSATSKASLDIFPETPLWTLRKVQALQSEKICTGFPQM